MKKKIIFLLFFLLTLHGVFADTLAGHLWGYAEKDGYCIVEDFGRLHYWLYDTYSYYDGNGNPLIEAFISYVECLGWTVDYDNIEYISPNNDLALSVKSMMTAKNSDVSMTIIEINKNIAFMYLNSYNAKKDYWFTYIYPLIK